MQQIWAGKTQSPDISRKYNCYLKKRLDNKVQKESDTRSFVKFILSQGKKAKPKECKNKVYQEACKQTIKKEDYWEAPPRGWQGTRLQWY